MRFKIILAMVNENYQDEVIETAIGIQPLNKARSIKK